VSKGDQEEKQDWEMEKAISEEPRSYQSPQSGSVWSPALAGFGYLRPSGATSFYTADG